MIHILFFLSYYLAPAFLKTSLTASYLLLLHTQTRPHSFLIAAFFCGCFFDLTTLSLPFGTYTAASTLLAVVIRYFHRFLLLESYLSFTLYTFLFDLAYHIAILLVATAGGFSASFNLQFFATDFVIGPVVDTIYAVTLLYLIPKALPYIRRIDILLAFFRNRSTTEENKS